MLLTFASKYDMIIYKHMFVRGGTKMRKIKILLLSLLLAFCMAGCSEGSSVAISGSGDETDGKISQNGSGMFLIVTHLGTEWFWYGGTFY